MPHAAFNASSAPALARHNKLKLLLFRSVALPCLAAGLASLTPASAQVTPQPRAAAPVLSLSSGTYSGPQTVSITDTTPGAVIYYTTNGAYPGITSSPYSTPITVSSSEIVVAVAIAPGYDNSTWGIGRYIISTSSTRWTYSLAGNGLAGYSGDGGPATLAQMSEPADTAIDAAGNIYVADRGNYAIRKINALTGIITTIAGTGVPGLTGDGGPATSAELNTPCCIAVDPLGNVFVAVAAGVPGPANFVVRKIDAASGTISSYAGALGGTVPGSATATSLNQIAGLATDAQGNLYINESWYIQKVTAATGMIATVAGNGLTYGDNGPATSAIFYSFGFSVDQLGNIYIADEEDNAVRKVNALTGIITTLAGGPSATAIWGDGGPATAARLNFPETAAVDAAGNVYIADALNYAIRKIDAGTGIISTVVGDGDYQSAGGDGDPSTSVGVGFLENLTADSAGNLFFTDNSSRVRKITLPTTPGSLTTAPVFSLSSGTYGSPQTVTVSDSGSRTSIYLSFSNDPPDTTWSGYFGPFDLTSSASITAVAVAPGSLPSAPVQRAYTITSPHPSVISTVAGVGYFGNSPSGVLAASTVFGIPEGIAVDQAGNLYVTEYGNSLVRKVSASTGVETIVAGTGTQGYNGDGIAATSAQLNTPYGVAVDKAGNVYIADSGNARVRRVDAATGLISTVAGGGSAVPGDGGPATSASLGYPRSLAIDSAGNLYIPDSNDRVRKVSAATGIISTIAGGSAASFSGDGGPAVDATLQGPTGVALDAVGDLIINDSGNQRLRKIDAKSGIITTIAGNGIESTPIDGSLATQTPLNLVLGSLASDAAGNVYFSNYGNSVARVDAITGVLTTAAGNHYEGTTGDGGNPTGATVDAPQGVALDNAGNLYIAEFTGYIRKVTIPHTSAPVFSLAGGTYHTPQSLTLTDATPGATIYYTYTANGATPTAASIPYTGPITINATGLVEAIALAPGYSQSGISAKAYTYTVLPPAASPVFSLAGGTYHSPQTLTLTDSTPGAAIHYTTNGTTPNASSTLYTGPITIASTELVEAVAIATGYAPSPASAKAYTYVPYPPAAAPAFSLAGGTYNTPQSLTLTDSTSGATIYYTTNGNNPTTASTVYSGPITIASTELVKAAAIATGYSLSPVSSKAYTYTPLPLAAAPYFSLAGGHYTTAQTLTLTDSTPGATIYFTTNGTIPTTASTRYAGPITISTTETVIAIAAAPGYSNSNPGAKAYTIP